MKVKVSEASGVMLDWMVAKCEEERTHYHDYRVADGELQVMYCDIWLSTAYAPSTNWAQGGPIIERGRISTEYTGNAGRPWFAKPPGNPTRVRKHTMDGPTLLITALRCYVASTLGEEVEVPTELLL